MRVGSRAVPFAIPAAAFAVLGVAHARGYFFLFDDYCLVGVAKDTSLRGCFANPLIGFYRPATFAWLHAEAAAFGWRAPAAYATVSLALHVANALLLGGLVKAIAPLGGTRSPSPPRSFSWRRGPARRSSG